MMKINSIAIIFLYLSCLKLVISVDLFVDANLTTENGNSYPSLSAAVTTLLSGNLDSENTITLSDSCLTVPQTLPSNVIFQGSFQESITIQYQANLTIAQSQDCQLLPTLVLSDDQVLQVNNFNSFSLIGLNIQYYGSVWQNSFYYIEWVTFSNFCFNNSEPTLADPGSNYPWYYTNTFSIDTLSYFYMKNGVFLFDGFKTFSISYSYYTSVVSVVFEALNSTQPSSQAAFYVYDSNLDMSNIQLICDTGGFVAPNIIVISSVPSANFSGFMFSNLTMTTVNQNSLINIEGGYTVLLDNFTFYNTTYPLHNYILSIDSVSSSTLSNFNFDSTNITTLVAFSDDNWAGYVTVGVLIVNWTFQNVSFSADSQGFISYWMLYVYYSGVWDYGSLEFQNLSILNSNFDPYSNFLIAGDATVESDESFYHSDSSPIEINGLTMTGNTLNQASVFNLTYTVTWETAIEVLHFELLNANITNNTFTQSSMALGDGVAVTVSNLLFKNNTLITSILFSAVEEKGSVIVYNSVFVDLNMTLKSRIIEYTTENMIAVELTLSINQTGLYAQTRPVIVHNCTFSNINLESSSGLVLSENSMVIIQNNTFQQIMMNDSTLLEIGGYILYFSDQSYFVDKYGGLYGIDYNWSATLVSYPSGERAVFRNAFFCQGLFDEARTRISEFDPLAAIFFMNVESNSFDSLQVYRSSNLINLNAFDVQNSSVTVVNNTFTSIICDSKLNLFYGTDISRLIFANNTLKELNLAGYMTSLQTSEMILAAFISNIFTDTNQLAFLSADLDECDNITIDGVQSWNVNSSQSFITVSCNTYTNPIVVQNSVFNNSILTSSPGILQGLSFIYIEIKEAPQSGNGTIYFQNNVLQNITVNNTEAAIKGIFQISVILIVAVDSTLFFQNNTLKTLKVTPEGTVMTISLTELHILSSNFTNFEFWDPVGAIRATCNFSMTNCVFKDNQGLNIYGAGLVNLINPSPSTSNLIAKISNSTFDGNIGPYGTILYTQFTSIQLHLTGMNVLNNYVTDIAGLIYLYNIYSSVITVLSFNFVSTQGSLTYLPELQIFTFQSPGIDVFMTLSQSSITLGGEGAGVIISVSGQESVMLDVSNLSFFLAPSESSSSGNLQFSILEADNIDAVFQNLNLGELSIQGVGLFVLNCDTEKDFAHVWALTIANSTFENLTLSNGLIVVNSMVNSDNSVSAALDTLSISIQNSTFQSISWSSANGGIVYSATNLIGKSQGDNFSITIFNSNFENLTGTQGLIYNGAESQYYHVLWISQSTLQSLETTEAGGIINPTSLLAKSPGSNNTQSLTYKISESIFQEINAGSGSLLYWVSECKGVSIQIENSSFENITSSAEGGVIYLQRQGTVNSSTLNQSFINTNLINVTSQNSSYTNIFASVGGIIYSDAPSPFLRIEVENSKFESIAVNGSGGIMQIITSAESSSSESSGRLLQNWGQYFGSIILLNSVFEGISAAEGGLIYEQTLNNTLLLNISSNEIQNFFVSDRGGVLFINQPIISISNNNFSNCSALVVGSIIYSLATLDLPDLDDANKITNSDYPLLSFAPTNLQISFLANEQIFQPENKPDYDTNPIYSNLTSYSLSNFTIYFSLTYESSQESLSVPDESSGAIITLVFVPQNGERNQTHIGTNCVNGSCSVNAEEITLQGDADDTILVNANYNSSLYTQFQQFYIKLRGCLPGEANDTSTKECIYCGYGTYSINPNNSKCNDCPVGVRCEGGSNLFIKTGYYRSENSSDAYIMSCNNSETDPTCLGGYNNSCVEAYTGPFCLQCNNDNGYLTSSGSCSKCYSSKKLLIAYGVLLLVGTVVYQIFMIVVTFRENHEIHQRYMNDPTLTSEVQPGAFLVIFSTFCQITTIISEFDVGTALQLFNISVNIGNPNSKAFFSIQCLYYLEVPDIFQALQFQLLCYVFSPFIKVAVAFVFEIFRGLLRRDRQGHGLRKAFTRIGAVATVLVLLEQPGIVGLLCYYLNCVQLDPHVNKYYISRYNNIECYTPSYYLIRNALVIPALIFWGFVVPVILILILYTKREKLSTSLGLRVVFGNFYNGYSQRAYYWGCVIMMSKLIVFILNSVLIASDLAKGVVLMCLFHLYYKIFKRNPPYNYESLNLAEEYCSRAYMSVLTLAVFRLTIENSTVQEMCNVLILLITIYTGGYILGNVFWIYISKVMNIADTIKMKSKNSKVIREILNNLENYHYKNPDRIDANYRRGAISLDLPSKLRFSAEDEVEKIQSERKKSFKNFRRKITRIYTKLFDYFTPRGPINSTENEMTIELKKIKESVKFDAIEPTNATQKSATYPLIALNSHIPSRCTFLVSDINLEVDLPAVNLSKGHEKTN